MQVGALQVRTAQFCLDEDGPGQVRLRQIATDTFVGLLQLQHMRGFECMQPDRAEKYSGKEQDAGGFGYSANEPVSIHSFFRMVQKSSARPFRM